MADDYIIYISKRRNPDDNYGIHWGKMDLPDYDEEKAKAKLDMLRLVLGDMFILTMSIRER